MGVLVIGYGNPLRQDDGLGWHVAERLRARTMVGVDVVASHQLAPELAEAISRAELVVFVDARHGTEPGRVTLQTTVASSEKVAFSHFLLPGQLLGLAGALYGVCPPAWTITVDGESFWARTRSHTSRPGHCPDRSAADLRAGRRPPRGAHGLERKSRQGLPILLSTNPVFLLPLRSLSHAARPT